MNARLVWHNASGQVRVSEDIVVYPGWNTIVVDLDQRDGGPFLKLGTDPGWDGHDITVLRLDPHEDSGARRFLVDWVKLTENVRPIEGVVSVRFQDRGFEAGSAAVAFLDRNGDGVKAPGDIWIGQRTVQRGLNTHEWQVPEWRKGSGEWFVSVRVTDRRGSATTTTSTGTVEI